MTTDDLERHLRTMRPQSLSTDARARLRQAITHASPPTASPPTAQPIPWMPSRHHQTWRPLLVAAATIAVVVSLALTEPRSAPQHDSSLLLRSAISELQFRQHLADRHIDACHVQDHDGLRRPPVRVPRSWQPDER